MMGLMVLIFFATYLLISIWAVHKATEWAKANNRKPWVWGGLSAFVMYNVVFWDFIPTLIVHKHYCDTQAGLWVYKTPEQWKAENPELTADDLKPLGKNKKMLWDFPRKPLKNNTNKIVLMINERIYLDSDYEKNILAFMPVRINKLTSFIADNRNDQRLAQLVTFESGYGGMMSSSDGRAMKFWLAKNNCTGLTSGDEERASGYTEFLKQIIKLAE